MTRYYKDTTETHVIFNKNIQHNKKDPSVQKNSPRVLLIEFVDYFVQIE